MEMLVVFFGACTGAIVCGWICVWRAGIARKREQEQRHAEYLIAAVQRMAQANRTASVKGHVTRLESRVVFQSII